MPVRSSATPSESPNPISTPGLTWLASMLQTTDPLFPIGSYAHSYGLEELCASGEVKDAATLLKFLESVVFLNLQEFELPYLRFSYIAAERNDFEDICQLDEEINASKPCKELRQASSSQGQQRLRLIYKLRPTDRFEALHELKKQKRIIPHHITIFAAENVDLGTPLDATLMSWTYQALAAPCAASLKLVRIGQEGAQTVLTKSLRQVATLIQRSQSIDREFAGAFLPNLDVASQRHEHAYARLFIS
ncbi:urease accessory UreF family protein [Pelagicoccus sp. SDUM812002]|uniref:urease accessory protein UreF n=1 Tax=Pelagicoccus sp. SDUM812002 TaxID=3041266 RepID=UPI00280D4B14|nr:urease accessory UreF family protein [Pelagicoccus sp. SDUM812002]MDQ8186126.1 urease accessory UreF family protein [Pelagicoccus sp. SDUM812002]